MGRPELGTKLTCVGCQERFYDLNRVPAVCPKCAVEQPAERPRAVRPGRSSFGIGSQPRSRHVPAATIDDEVEPVSTAEVEADGDVPDVDEDADDDIEHEAALPKTDE